MPHTEVAVPSQPPPKRFTRIHGIVATLVLVFFWLMNSSHCQHGQIHKELSSKVPLEIHIMYTCYLTKHMLFNVLMQYPGRSAQMPATVLNSL